MAHLVVAEDEEPLLLQAQIERIAAISRVEGCMKVVEKAFVEGHRSWFFVSQLPNVVQRILVESDEGRARSRRSTREIPIDDGGVDAPHRVFLNFFDHRHQAAEQVAGILVGRVHVRIDLLVATGAFWKMAAAALEHRLDEGGTSVAPLKVKPIAAAHLGPCPLHRACRSPRGNGPPVSAERTTWAPSEAGTRLSSPWTASDRRRTRNGRVGGRSPPFGRGVFHATPRSAKYWARLFPAVSTVVSIHSRTMARPWVPVSTKA